jgi:hypothetical protein
VQFTPSDDELRDANAQLRTNIYLQSKEELDRINKAYPDQKYFVHDVNFINTLTPMPMPPQANMMAMRVASAGVEGGNLAVGDKLVVSATIVVASMPDQSLTKLFH